MMSTLLREVAASMSPMWLELSLFLCFFLGFAFFRLYSLGVGKTRPALKNVDEPRIKPFDPKLKKTIDAETGPRGATAVLAAWRVGEARAPTPPDLVKPVIQAFVEVAPEALSEEFVAHMQEHADALLNTRTVVRVLDVVARAGNLLVMEELWQAFQDRLRITPTIQEHEVLLGGFATAGDETKVAEIVAEVRAKKLKLTARAYALTIKGFLKNGMVDAVLHQILEMQKEGFHLPDFAVAQFFRIACDADRTVEIFGKVQDEVVLPADAMALLLADCAKRNDFDLARRLEQRARDAQTPLLCGAYDALLKLHAVAGDLHALRLFAEMQETGTQISVGLCVGLLARCAEAKFLRFAEEIVGFVRSRQSMTIAVYSALMKVYAYCGMYDRACNLYDQIRGDGLEPDAMTYGCLMKFAVECGRTDLSRELSEKAPSLDIQNYMSLIRAAGRDKDVAGAFGVLDKLKSSGVQPDIAAYNCVLDVCVSTGDMRRARQLVEVMRGISAHDIITFNTLLKGYCTVGDLQGAKRLLEEMTAAGLPPNDVSYNCLINAAVSSGHRRGFEEAWEIIEMMEQNGVAIDHFTISTMMKALKKVTSSRDVGKVLALWDRAGLDVCSDEILLNTVLDTCIRHREYRRLEAILSSYQGSTLRPSVHTFGALIKACSVLNRVDCCWEFWREMEQRRGMEPNDVVLGCMIDALVCNSDIEGAVALFDAWKEKVPPNTVIYSTLIKGFANTRQADRALSAWREIRKAGLPMNTVVYNAVIDAHARVGAMDEVSELITMMGPDGCEPDAITFSTVVKGYCVNGDLDKAFVVFCDMQKSRMAGDSVVYNTILDGCTRHGRMDLADQVLADMEKFNIVPSNFTLGSLVKMYGRRRQIDKAFTVVETLPKKYGFKANAQVQTCLMCACLNNNALDKAFCVFEELKVCQGADAKAYGSLISGCIRNGQLNRAVSLVEEFYNLSELHPSSVDNCGKRGKLGVNLEPAPLEHLFRTLAQKRLQVAFPLFEKLRAVGAPVDGRFSSHYFGGVKG